MNPLVLSVDKYMQISAVFIIPLVLEVLTLFGDGQSSLL